MYKRSLTFFCAMTLVFAFAMAADAEDREMPFKKGSFHLTPTAGAMIFLGDDNSLNTYNEGAIMGGRIGYYLTDHWSIDLSFEYAWISAAIYRLPPYTLPTRDGHVNVFLPMANVLYHFKPIFTDGLSPFLIAGAGVNSYSSCNDYNVGAAFNYGAGLEYKINDWLSVNGMIRGLTTTHPATNALLCTVGLGLHAGGAEEAPPPPPPPPPPLDSDGDGVPDDIDECPGTPPGTEVDEVGCPKLPHEGVLYEMPLDGAIQQGIVFELNSAKIRPYAYPLLNDVAATLKEYPHARVEIAGYTDITGPEAFNMKLSQARADSVRDYLVSQGVPPDQLTTKGYGEANPIASNATREGRELNRRIEFHLLTPINPDMVKEGTVLYKLSHGGIVISGDIFQTGSASVRKDAYPQLEAMARTLRAFPSVEVEVTGYTDSTGSEELNQKLSLKRANAVAKFLIDRGVKPDQLVIRGLGEENPIASNDTEEGRAQNRRIEFQAVRE